MELPQLREKYQITGMLTNGSLTQVKMIAQSQPLPEAKVCAPDVEDAYMYLMQRQGGAC